MSESLPNWDACLQVASLSDVGMRRSNNQDNFTISMASTQANWEKRGHLFIVADGMGAHAAGELASKIAVDQIPHLYSKYDDLSAPEALGKAVQAANFEIHRRGQANEEFHNMGTTCSVLAVLPEGAMVAHIGDSRAYRLREHVLEQLTFDHSLVWEMRAAGQITEAEEKSGKIPKNVITRSLGPYAECKVDLEGPFPIRVGDTFLLCSDGLTGQLADGEIGAILASLAPQEAARVLVDLANLRGGPDNITVIIVKVLRPEMATPGTGGTLAGPSAGNSSQGPGALAWSLLGAAALAAILLFVVTQNWMMAVIPGLTALGALFWILFKLVGPGIAAPKSPLQRYGRAPYARVDCGQGDAFTRQLAEVIRQLQEGAVEQNWNVDWSVFQKMVDEARQATQAGDYSAAVRNYGRAISLLMDQLRRNSDNDSGIDL